MKINILVCTHKPMPSLNDSVYMAVYGGKALSGSQEETEIVGDDCGKDNISAKNKEFCELTCHYWAWKNLKEVDYIGLCHYRRFFDFDSPHPGQMLRSVLPENFTLPKTDFEKIFRKYDIILTRRDYHKVSNKMHYCYYHSLDDFNVLREVIAERKPEYLRSFDRVTVGRNKFSVGNMFCCSWDLFDSYSAWLFDILFEVEKRVYLSPNPFQRRVFGFMSERLLDVYCHHHHLKAKRFPILFIGDRKNRTTFQRQFNILRKNLFFLLSSKKRV